LKEAIRIAVGNQWEHPETAAFWWHLLPFIPMGFVLYMLQRFHIVPPIILFPFFLVFPIVMFYLCMSMTGHDIEYMRQEGWMLQENNRGLFYEQWIYLDFKKVNLKAVLDCIPDLLTLVLVITFDAFLKLSATKKKLGAATMDIVHDLKIAGYQNIVSAFCVGTAGYSLVKFNLLNFDITKDINERRATICVGVICGAVWVSGLPLTNIFPRFYLAGLLLFNSLTFFDMVIMAYWSVSKKEFAVIIIIIVVNAIATLWVSSNLIIAVIFGLILSAIIFLWEYSRVSVIRGEKSGKDDNSTVIRSYEQQRLVTRLGRRYAILQLQGFIFFGTATQVLDWTKKQERRNMMLSSCKKIRYIAMDFKNVKNMDFSCANSFMDINEIIQKMGCQLLIVCLNRKVKIKLQQEGLLDRPGVLTFRDLDHASEYVEDSILYRASFIRLHWLMFDSFRKLHTRALQTASYEIFQSLFGPYIGKRIWRYAERREFKSGEFLFREGDMNPTLFLLQYESYPFFASMRKSHLNHRNF